LTEAGAGFIARSIAGSLVGFVLGWVCKAGDLLEPFVISFLYAAEDRTRAFVVLWFGIGPTNKIMFAAMLVFFMVFFTTYQGTRQVDRDLVENALLLGASRWAAWTKIAVPYSAVWVFTGIRIGLPYALIGAVVGEFVAADSGVGFRVKEATSFFNTASVFAGADGHQPDAVGRFEPESSAACCAGRPRTYSRMWRLRHDHRRVLLGSADAAFAIRHARAATSIMIAVSSTTLVYGGLRDGAWCGPARERH
jgi:ABC-type proline/glycine betaine transport system permease subunit